MPGRPTGPTHKGCNGLSPPFHSRCTTRDGSANRTTPAGIIRRAVSDPPPTNPRALAQGTQPPRRGALIIPNDESAAALARRSALPTTLLELNSFVYAMYGPAQPRPSSAGADPPLAIPSPSATTAAETGSQPVRSTFVGPVTRTAVAASSSHRPTNGHVRTSPTPAQVLPLILLLNPIGRSPAGERPWTRYAYKSRWYTQEKCRIDFLPAEPARNRCLLS